MAESSDRTQVDLTQKPHLELSSMPRPCSCLQGHCSWGSPISSLNPLAVFPSNCHPRCDVPHWTDSNSSTSDSLLSAGWCGLPAHSCVHNADHECVLKFPTESVDGPAVSLALATSPTYMYKDCSPSLHPPQLLANNRCSITLGERIWICRKMWQKSLDPNLSSATNTLPDVWVTSSVPLGFHTQDRCWEPLCLGGLWRPDLHQPCEQPCSALLLLEAGLVLDAGLILNQMHFLLVCEDKGRGESSISTFYAYPGSSPAQLFHLYAAQAQL